MGDPKKQKKKYRRPLMVWNEELIANQKKLSEQYGLKNRREIWKVDSALKSIHDQAKKLTAEQTEQAEKESIQLIKRLVAQGLIPEDSKLEDVLSLTTKHIFERRLQTFVFNKGFSRTIKQARQFITHNHISISDQVINVPSYPVKISEESLIRFNPSSNLANEMHPERPKEESLKKEKVIEEIKSSEKEKVEEKEIAKEKTQKKVKELENAVPEEKITHKEK